MNLFNINISFSYWKLVILGFIALCFTILVIWLVCSYYIYKWLKMNIDKDYFYFNEYNTDCKNIIKQYGDYPIKRIYLVRQPITKMARILLNIITLYKFEREMKKYIETTKNSVFFPRHTSIIVEVELPNQIRKKILIEKNNCIKLALDFRITNNQDMRKISIGKKKYTIKKILEKTKNRIGNNIFFNWSISRNNCQIFTEELLKSINKYNTKNKKFISQNDFINQMKYPEFSLHVLNSIANIYNIVESIIGKSIYF